MKRSIEEITGEEGNKQGPNSNKVMQPLSSLQALTGLFRAVRDLIQTQFQFLSLPNGACLYEMNRTF